MSEFNTVIFISCLYTIKNKPTNIQLLIQQELRYSVKIYVFKLLLMHSNILKKKDLSSFYVF